MTPRLTIAVASMKHLMSSTHETRTAVNFSRNIYGQGSDRKQPKGKEVKHGPGQTPGGHLSDAEVTTGRCHISVRRNLGGQDNEKIKIHPNCSLLGVCDPLRQLRTAADRCVGDWPLTFRFTWRLICQVKQDRLSRRQFRANQNSMVGSFFCQLCRNNDDLESFDNGEHGTLISWLLSLVGIHDCAAKMRALG